MSNTNENILTEDSKTSLLTILNDKTVIEEGKNPNGNTNKVVRARRWTITLNNWSKEEYDTITHWLISRNCLYIIGKEIGEEKGTPHLQMYIESKNAISNVTLKKIMPRANLQKSKGNREQNISYCSKDGDFACNFPNDEQKSLEEMLLEIEFKDIIWHDWQQKIIDILEETPDKRKIYWFWEEDGNVGKSFLCKYITLKMDAIICSGKTNDIFNQLKNWRDENPKTLQIPPCIIDIPRSEFCHTNYSAIEQIKNGFIYSGKYEGGKIVGLSPHIIVFANSEPETTQLSLDRFDTTKIIKTPEASLP